VGGPLRLDARASLPRLGNGKGKGLKYRWRVLRASRGSRVRPDRAAFATAAAAGDAPGTCDSNRAAAQTLSAGPLASDQLAAEAGSGAGAPETTSTATATTPTAATTTPTPTATTPTATTTTPTATTTTPTTTTPAPVAPSPAPVAPAQTGLATVDTPTTTFTPDVPGCYQLGLTVTDGGASSTPDVVTVQVPPAAPLVWINTDAQQGGNPGIQVGDAFYPADTSVLEGPTLQVVALKRTTLNPVAFGGQSSGNQAYACPNGDCSSSSLSADLKALQDDDLVIVAGIPFEPPFNNSILNDLTSIGVAPTQAPGDSLPSSYFAAVGIPGLPSGEARVSVSPSGESSHGIQGALAKDQFRNYKLVSTHFVGFDTRADGSTATADDMQVGTQTYSAQLPAGAMGGFHVVVLSAFDLSLKFNDTIVTAPASSADVSSSLQRIANAAPGEHPVVLVSSIGSPVADSNAIADQWNQLADWIANNGGTADAIQRYQPGQTYSLAGSDGVGQGMGTEVGSMLDAGSQGRITGELVRNAQWKFAPAGGEAVGSLSPSLMNVIYQQPTPWPRSDPAAMQYIASAPSVNLGTDVRVAYWNQSPDWDTVRTSIQALTYPGDGHGFSRSDFASLQNELFLEIGWLTQAQKFLNNLAQPFSGGEGFSAWLSAKNIASKINAGVQAPPDTDVELEDFFLVVGDLFGIASFFGGDHFNLVSNSLYAASDISSLSQSGESNNNTYTTTVDNYTTQLVKQFGNVQKSYAQFADIAASDWAKLCTLGTRHRCDAQSGGPTGPSLWQFTQDDQTNASVALQLWARRDAWRALLPAKFSLDVFRGKDYPKNGGHAFPSSEAESYFLRNMICEPSFVPPFGGVPASAEWKLWSETTADGSGFDMWAVGNIENAPTSSLTDQLWAPVDPAGNPDKGGLGFKPSHFPFRAWPPSQIKDFSNSSVYDPGRCVFE
jgi:hypothetical protein